MIAVTQYSNAPSVNLRVIATRLKSLPPFPLCIAWQRTTGSIKIDLIQVHEHTYIYIIRCLSHLNVTVQMMAFVPFFDGFFGKLGKTVILLGLRNFTPICGIV